MLKYVPILFIVLAGCFLSTQKPLVRTTPPLDIKFLPQISMESVEFTVVHKNNASSKFADLEKSGQEPVMFCLSGPNYKSLAKNTNRIKNRMSLHNRMIKAYIRYYEARNNGTRK